MNSNILRRPARDELEVSIFGPGYGESVVIHLGDGQWMIVDSCLDGQSDLPAPLAYLFQLDVEVDKSVRLIVATHWHDDHIRGISGVFNACHAADFVVSSALDSAEFLKLVALFSNRRTPVGSGVDEFCKVFELLRSRKQTGVRFNPPRFASADRLLLRDDLNIEDDVLPVSVYSLSPSDATLLHAKLTFERLVPISGESKKRIASPKSNHSSAVLWVEIGQHKILLGADLEETSDPKTGWSVIVKESKAISDMASVFKVPHHGSENAHNDRVWTHLLTREPFAVLSPFSRGVRPLPTKADVSRIANLTPNAYLTAPARQKKERWRNRVVRDFVADMTKRMTSSNNGWGHIRLRKNIRHSPEVWEVTLFGDAYRIATIDGPV